MCIRDSDEIIKGDLKKLSEGALELAEDDVIDVSAVKYTRSSTSRSNHGRRKGGRNNYSNNKRRNNNNKSSRRRR